MKPAVACTCADGMKMQMQFLQHVSRWNINFSPCSLLRDPGRHQCPSEVPRQDSGLVPQPWIFARRLDWIKPMSARKTTHAATNFTLRRPKAREARAVKEFLAVLAPYASSALHDTCKIFIDCTAYDSTSRPLLPPPRCRCCRLQARAQPVLPSPWRRSALSCWNTFCPFCGTTSGSVIALRCS